MNRSDPAKSRAAPTLRSILRSIVHYARDAGGAVIAFLVGTAFTLGGFVSDLLGVHVRGRLAEAGGGLLMVCAQFWAYHKLRMRNIERGGASSSARRDATEVTRCQQEVPAGGPIRCARDDGRAYRKPDSAAEV